MEFRILGPLEVRVDGVAIGVGGPKQRALLALLLLSANRVVSLDRLSEELPGSDRHVLAVNISRLRGALAAEPDGAQRLVQQSPGYRLRVDPGELDLDSFEELVAQGRRALEEGDVELASSRLRMAESLFRGPLLAGVDLGLTARLEADRLEELRLAAVEERIEAELAFGRHGLLVPELETLVVSHPLRERLREYQMLALYRAGRQADALAAFRAARSLLVEQLGLEPGPRLRELEQAILRHDGGLDLRARPAGPRSEPLDPAGSEAPDRPATTGRTWRRRARAALAAGATAGVTAAVVVAFVVSGSRTARLIDENALALVSSDGTLKTELRLPSAPTQLASGFGSLWVSQVDADSVVRVDQARETVVDTIRVGDGPSAIATGGGDVWVVNTLDGSVSRIDPDSDTVTQTIALAGEPESIVVADGSVWVSRHGEGTLVRIDAATGRVRGVTKTGGGPAGLAASAGSVWVADDVSGTVTRVDAVTGTVNDTIHVGDAPAAIAATRSGVWVLDRIDSTVSRIEPATDRVAATYPVAGDPSGLAVDRGAVWVAQPEFGSVSRLDPRDGAPSVSARVGQVSQAVVVERGVWLTVAAGGRSHRGGTLTVASTNGPINTIDPAEGDSWDVPPPQFLGLVYDGLVTLRHAAGPGGTRLVPDLAVALPRPRDGGLAYVFRLRPDVRFSTGERVEASDVRSSFERLFQVRSSGAALFGAIVGAAACTRAPERCDLSRGIVADDRTGTVTFRLVRPDPDLLYKLTVAFADVLPASTRRRVSEVPLPATGPYMIARYIPGRLVRLVRNPRFREWSATAQPQGYPDEIVFRISLGAPRAADLVAHGRADLAVNLGTVARDRAYFLLHHPSEVHANPALITGFLFLNVKVPPFDDVRARRALNLALDRTRMVAVWGGPDAARPTCQLLPPGLPGYRAYCPYTRSPGPDGRWHGADLARARRLVAESGTRGMTVVVLNSAPGGEGPVAVDALRRLGYRATQRLLPDNTAFFDYTNDSRNRAQVVEGGWSADYPSADDFLGKLTCANFVAADGAATNDASEFCDPTFDRRVAQAASLQTTDPLAANALWAKLDHDLTDRAILLTTVTPDETDVVSKRVGNYQYNPVWGPLVDQLWVR